MKLKKKSKAFTLTELLVVVVVIGVLSAVVLPKYSKVIETRRTTEAEELMGAIRTEQEKRCALDKEYLMKFDGLKDIVKNPDTKNYKLALASTGINATRNDKYSYTLEMPSYADGRICCSGADCEKLNKNYPACEDLKNKSKTPDYQDSPASCAGTPPPPPVIPCSGASSEKCGCQNKGTRTRTCDTSTGTWSNWSACSVSAECECTGPEPDPSQPCNGCGNQTRSVTCNTTTGEWETGSWGECSKTKEECAPKDCCDEDFTGDFAQCLKDNLNYDSNSPEYICADGHYSDRFGRGPFSGASACAFAVFCGTPGSVSDHCERGDPAGGWKSFVSSVVEHPLNAFWVNGYYKKYACHKKKPLRPDETCRQGETREVERQSECGSGIQKQKCDNGKWVNEGETSWTKNPGADTQEIRVELDCGFATKYEKCEFRSSASGYNWVKSKESQFELKEGSECIATWVDGLFFTYPTAPSGYYCDARECKWKESSSGSSGGTGGSGGGGGCYRFTDMYSGSFCQLCTPGYGFTYCW